MESRNPTTGAVLATYEVTPASERSEVVERAHAAFEAWRAVTVEQRAALLRSIAEGLRRDEVPLSRLAALEMGKPVSEGRAEVEKCAWVCDHYAAHAAGYLRDEPVPTDAAKSYVTFRPLGVILAVMPWNFPFWQVFRCLAPAVAAGNAVVLKHASNVTGCAKAIGELIDAAGAPPGLFGVLVLSSADLGPVIDHPHVRGVSVTGGAPAGRAVAARAGAGLKKVVLELGGSDPYVVLADADMPATVTACAAARLINGGQSCIAAKRFIVVSEAVGPFEAGLVERFGSVRVGDPLDPETQLGPMARRDLRDELHDQVRRTVEAGARLLCGGRPTPGGGAFYPPTVLSGVRPGMAAFDEETFGPVAAIVSAADEREAVTLANASRFGLGAAVFSADPGRAERMAAVELDAGSCFVNTAVRSDPRLPFGGVKESGFGRELGRLGILEFVNAKTVVVA
jgi:succinate-semialdehyde dehydrogenase/glutarate-semialdehyde dehydrogenase